MRLAEPRQVEANREHMDLLVSMGFSEAGARHALVRSDNSLEAAINLLTSMPAGWEPPADAAVPAAQPGANSTATQHASGPDDASRGEQEQPSTVHSGEVDEVSIQPVAGVTGDENSDGNQASTAHGSSSSSDMPIGDEEQPLLGARSSAGVDPGAAAEDINEEQLRNSNFSEVGRAGTFDGNQPDADAHQADDVEHLPLDTPTMMELQEGMRGLMTALNATTGLVSDAAVAGGGTGGGPMSGAMPILATGGGNDSASILDPMRLVDEMRWGGALPAMLGGLLGADEEGALAFDEYRSESTAYADEDEEESDDGVGDGDASEDEN